MPQSPSPGFGISLPLGLMVHAALLSALLHSSFRWRPADVPAIESYRIQLFAPPAAALRSGDPTARPNPEDRARTPRPAAPEPPASLVARADLLAMLDRVEFPPSFGAAHGIPEGGWDGFAWGVAEGVVGGVPGGAPGGQIGGLPRDADPVLPPPDEPPAALRMPRPRFPTNALRNGVRGSVVLRALITEQGTVEVLRVLRSVPGLDDEAIRVVEAEWRFRPARRNGRPVPSLSDLVVRFTLR